MARARFLDNVGVSAFGSNQDAATSVSSSYASFATSASYAVTASHALFAVSASHEIVKEVSSSHANTADVANGLQGQPSIDITNITASANVSSSATSTSSFGTYLGDGSQLSGIETDPFPYTGDAVISGSTTITGSLNVFGGIRQTSGVGANVVLIGNSATLGTTANAEGAVAIGDGAFADMKGIGIGEVARAGLDAIAIGAGAGSGTGTGRGSIAIGINARPNATAISSIALVANDQNEGPTTVSEPRTFGVYLENSNNDAPDLKFIVGPASASYWSGSGYFGLNTKTPTAALDVVGNISSSGAISASTYYGDGSQLTGIVTATNLTQSLFVTPSGDNATATVGDLMKPFSTILGATGSANIGDTIIVYPGTYVENHNLYKDGINYHFIDGAKVKATSPIEPMWGGGSGQANTIGTSYSSSISITGHGEFISTTSNTQKSAIFYIQAPSGVIEFKRALKHGIGGNPYNLVAGFGQVTSFDPTGVLTVRGKFENSGSASSYGSVVSFGQGNINTDIVVRSLNGTATGVYMWADTGDLNGTMDVYSEATGLYSQTDTSQLTDLRGRFETLTTNQGSYYALYLAPGYRGSFQVNAEIRGAIYINPGGAYEGSVKISGYQEVSNSPGGGANVILSGHNQLSQKIYGVGAATAAFKITGGTNTYDGFVRLSGQYPKLFDISAGIFHWKGTAQGLASTYPTTYLNPSEVSGGELIIESQLDNFNAGDYLTSGKYIFNLSGGTLDIRNKIRQHESAGNNGIVDMTGGYLKMNGAELVHATKTGSFAYAIDLNNQTHSGSILNNCFTNLQPFNSGSFTNEIVGGGTLFESHKLY